MNSFYSRSELLNLGFKKIGENVNVSKKTSIYGIKYITLGDNVRIDDYCCLVANENEIIIGSYVHIAFFCILVGTGGIILENFSGLSSRVSIYSATDDYSGESLTNPTVPEKYKKICSGKVILKKHVIIGTNTTILPNVVVGTGTSVGANGLVVKSLDSWGVYVGSPVKKIKIRSKELLNVESKLLFDLKDDVW